MKDKLKTYVCKYCKNKYDMLVSKRAQRSMTALKSCCTSPECMFKAYQFLKEKQEKQKRREWQKRKEKLKVEIGVKKQSHEEPLQKSINKIARLLDKDLPCIARPIETHTQFDAGHCFSIGSHPALRYNVDNIFKQSVKSNRDLGGEQSLMIEGIEILHGKAQREKTEGLIKKYPILKLTYDEKKEALKKANQIIRDIENKGIKYTRDDVNRIIGIYK